MRTIVELAEKVDIATNGSGWSQDVRAVGWIPGSLTTSVGGSECHSGESENDERFEGHDTLTEKIGCQGKCSCKDFILSQRRVTSPGS